MLLADDVGGTKTPLGLSPRVRQRVMRAPVARACGSASHFTNGDIHCQQTGRWEFIAAPRSFPEQRLFLAA